MPSSASCSITRGGAAALRSADDGVAPRPAAALAAEPDAVRAVELLLAQPLGDRLDLGLGGADLVVVDRVRMVASTSPRTDWVNGAVEGALALELLGLMSSWM